MKKLFKYFFFLFCFSTFGFVALVGYLYNSTSPKHDGQIKFKGLYGKVTIVRDELGIPRIKAESNDLDAYFALGFTHAQDRFWQMEVQRRIVQGRLSEIFGEEALDNDKILRTWQFQRAAKSSLDVLNDNTQKIIESYTAGVNEFLKLKKYPIEILLLGYEPEPWTNIDTISWQKILAWNLDRAWEEKLKNYLVITQLGQEKFNLASISYPKDAPITLSDSDWTSSIRKSNKLNHSVSTNISTIKNIKKKDLFDGKISSYIRSVESYGLGSNAWVISGQHTETGKPILANDPHLSFSAPNLWYLATMQGPNLNVTGATIPGFPSIVIGHNKNITWGVTAAVIDNQDLFINPSNQVIIEERIKVKNKQDVLYSVKLSDEGPVISSIEPTNRIGRDIAIKWPALMPRDKSVQALITLGYANNWEEFKLSLSEYVAPAQNFLYADIKGNIGYYLAARIPIRNNIDPRFPVNSGGWTEYIPFNEMPHVLNPEKGYIVSANNKIVSEQYPFLLTSSWNVPPYRAKRITDTIINSQKINIEDTKKLQNDIKSYLWLDFMPILLEKTKPNDDLSEVALEKLQKWDGEMVRNRIEPTIWSYWYEELSKMNNIIDTPFKWSESLFLKKQLSSEGSFCLTEFTQNCSDYLSKSLHAAMTRLKSDNGDNLSKWQWGRVHQAQFKGLVIGESPWLGWLWNRDIATNGGKYTVNVGIYDDDFKNIVGPGYRQIIDLADIDNNSLFILSLGQSGNILHKNYDDMLQLWQKSDYIKLYNNNLIKKLSFEPSSK
ncbi:penicillin acylase family protein [Photorhabdus luminescens]|uniref:Penicillin acylase family protein n=1 Tax=Photorhabdus akhurstii TaxID=171438 RepID=A0ABX8M2L2_9GAMM|nr:penicillin acylase family protein [Photorhabdus akhurstii]QXF35448.1 hypothetical protein B0X70_21325 [Photorhabdus akhurstii]UJD77279.1 penicillin acylase family protein [Photorhabdus luminescens]